LYICNIMLQIEILNDFCNNLNATREFSVGTSKN